MISCLRNNQAYKKLGEVATFSRGLTFAKDDVADISSKKVLRSNNIDLNSHSLNFDDIVCLNEGFVIPNEKKLHKGDIFICMSNGSTQHLGKVAFIEDDMDYAFGGFMGAIHPNQNEINPKFVFYACLSYKYRYFLTSILNGININNLKWSDLSKFPIPVPPLSIQSRIVSELDLLQSLIDKQKAQLKEYDTLAQSIFYDMFGDPVENEKGWEVKKLGEVGHIARGVSKHRPRNAPELLGNYMPFIQTGDIANSGMYITDCQSGYSELGVAQSKIWHKGTLCITIAANIGKCAIMTFDACFPDSVVGFIAMSNISLVEYVYYFFLCVQKDMEENAMGVAQKNINLAILNSMNIPVPPLSLQQTFAAKIESIEKQKAAISKSIAETEKLFEYTMDKYFG